MQQDTWFERGVFFPAAGGQNGVPVWIDIRGGQAETLAVDTEILSRCARALHQTQEYLEDLSVRIRLDQEFLYQCFLGQQLWLQTMCGVGVPGTEAELVALRRDWAEYQSALAAVLGGNYSVEVIRQKLGELRERLLLSSGLYESAEARAVGLTGGGWWGWVTRLCGAVGEATATRLENEVIPGLSRLIIDRDSFPVEFTVDGVAYSREDYSDLQLTAIYLSWLEQRFGAQVYQRDTGIEMHGPQGTEAWSTSGFADSPELNQYFSKLGQTFEWFDAEDPGFGAKVVAAAAVRWYLPSFKDQASARAERKALFPQSLTGRVLGAGRIQRIQTKSLEVGPYRRLTAAARSGGAAAVGAAETGGATAVGAVAAQESAVLGKETKKENVKRYLPRKPSELMDYASAIDPVDGGAFEVQQWRTATGKEGVRVLLRGTESWDAGSEQIQDMLTNTEEISAWESGQRQAVAKALAQLEIKPDTPMEIVGHSQAGIVAVNLAADPNFTAQYNVKAVITAGSPVAEAKLPQQTYALHLENMYDVVPKLEGAENAYSARHITARINMGFPGFEEGIGGAVTAAHERNGVYREGFAYLEKQRVAKIENFLKCRDNEMGLNHRIESASSTRFEVLRY